MTRISMRKDEITIVDPISRNEDGSPKIRQVCNVSKTVYVVTDNGKKAPKEFVKMTVLGRNHSWPLFLPFDAFKLFNPMVEVA